MPGMINEQTFCKIIHFKTNVTDQKVTITLFLTMKYTVTGLHSSIVEEKYHEKLKFHKS
jgi:hypothetical protein